MPRTDTFSCCLGHDLLARCPADLRLVVEGAEGIARLDLAARGLSGADLAAEVREAQAESVEGIVLADWLVAGAPRPEGTPEVVGPLARLVAALHRQAEEERP